MKPSTNEALYPRLRLLPTVSDQGGTSGFDKSRAELFEALGHPMRIRILHVLASGPMGFSELKRSLGIESSGHLQFHLGRLDGLVKLQPDGNYSLTDDGKEALLVVGRPETLQRLGMSEIPSHRVLTDRRLRAAFIFASVSLVVLGAFFVVFGGTVYYCDLSAPTTCSRTFYFVAPFQVPEFVSLLSIHFDYTMNLVGLVMLCAGALSLLWERRTSPRRVILQPEAITETSSPPQASPEPRPSEELGGRGLRPLGALGLLSVAVPSLYYVQGQEAFALWSLGGWLYWLQPYEGLCLPPCSVPPRVFSVLSILFGPYFKDFHPLILGMFLLLQFPLAILGGYFLLRRRSIGGALLLASAFAFIPCWVLLSQPFLGELPLIVPVGAIMAGVVGVASLVVGKLF